MRDAVGERNSIVQVVSGRCVRTRSRRAGCDRCEVVCPVGAVRLSRQPEIADACIGCGLCAAVCPVAALQIEGQSAAEILASARAVVRLSPDEPLVFVCRSDGPRLARQRGAQAIVVACIGSLTVELLSTVYAETRCALVLHQATTCGACSNRAGRRQVASVVQAMNALAPGSACLGDAARLASRTLESLDSAPGPANPSRRTFFRRLTHRAADVVQRAAAPEPRSLAPAAVASTLEGAEGMMTGRGVLIRALSQIAPPPETPLPIGRLTAGWSVRSAPPVARCARLAPFVSSAMRRSHDSSGAHRGASTVACAETPARRTRLGGRIR